MSMHKKFPSIVYTRIILFGKPFYRYIIRIVLGDNGSVMMSGTIFHCKIQHARFTLTFVSAKQRGNHIAPSGHFNLFRVGLFVKKCLSGT